MEIIKSIARYLIFIVALVMIIPFHSKNNTPITWKSVAWSIYMILIALDMLSFIVKMRRVRAQKILEIALYGSFIIMLFYYAATNTNLR